MKKVCFSCINHEMKLRCQHAGVCMKGKGITSIMDWCDEWERDKTKKATSQALHKVLGSLHLKNLKGIKKEKKQVIEANE